MINQPFSVAQTSVCALSGSQPSLHQPSANDIPKRSGQHPPENIRDIMVPHVYRGNAHANNERQKHPK